MEARQNIICPFCRKDIMPDSHYCIFCGNDLSGQKDREPADTFSDPDVTIGFCRECGADIPLYSRYCSECGSAQKKTVSFTSDEIHALDEDEVIRMQLHSLEV